MGDAALRVAVLGRSVYGLHGLGGLERHLFDLVRSHLAAGMHVTLVTKPPLRGVDPFAVWGVAPADGQLQVHVVPYRTFPLASRRGTTIADRSTAYPLFGWRAGRLAARLVADARVDVVYAVGASGLGYASARRHGARAPFVLNPQGMEEFGGPDRAFGGHVLKRAGYLPLRTAVRLTARGADRVIATDRALAPAVVAHLGIAPDRVRLVPNAIDVEGCGRLAGRAEGRAERQRLGIGDDEVVLLSVGRLERNKGFHLLAAALGGFRPQARWRWVLAGDGPFRAGVEEAIDRAGIRDRVSLEGRVPDRTLHAWFEAADLFVHPTLYEGSSLVTLEAMAHRRPVVATRAGGLPDKVRHGETGWLVAPDSPDALRQGLETAFAARSRWPGIGEAGAALARSTFDWPVVHATLVAVYHELLDRERAGATRA